MRSRFRKGVLAAAIVLPALSSTQIPVSAQSGQEQRGKNSSRSKAFGISASQFGRVYGRTTSDQSRNPNVQ